LYCREYAISSVSSSLLLRNSPHAFALIPIPSMCLSSLNRSISKAFRHIMPYSAPLCQALHYSKTGVPWQIKSTFIIYTKLLKLRYFPVFSSIFSSLVFHPNLTYLGISWHIFPCKSGKKSGKRFALTTRLFQAPATLRISSFASSKFTWVYVFKVTLISECPIIYCRVLGFIPDFAILEQKV